MTRSPKQIRAAATAASKGGRLHPDCWAEVDDLVLDERPAEAAELLAQHITPEPALPCRARRTGTCPCLTSKRPAAGQRSIGAYPLILCYPVTRVAGYPHMVCDRSTLPRLGCGNSPRT